MVAHQKHWYAVYTKSRAEKNVHLQLCRKNITSFLPLTKEIRQWSDRKKWVELPLLPSYLFVQVSAVDQFNVLNTPGAVRYISFEGRPAPIAERQIISLQNMLANRPSAVEVEYSDVCEGDEVEVVSGPLRGITGEVVKLKGKYRILLRFKSIQCCVHAEISLDEIALLENNKMSKTLAPA